MRLWFHEAVAGDLLASFDDCPNAGMQMESNWVLGLNQVLVSANVLAGWELVAVGLCLEKDYFLDVLISLDVVSAAVLLVLHPIACIAGRGVWRVDVGFCFYVLLVSVVPCRATVEFCVSPYACCVLFGL
ncbi:hypothetical protein Nepgr_018754 [Nepenthes gracilis]|uniref:Uncharacterized protein n=1 Tax=Nepenthes gracilis TaxID=150966 RepID=A0AAD3SSR4_NEPGR|nr:hypothetical protein Nepgr_018754 [Nepenthes gracilis]